jgi:hypothetical protein
MLKEFYLFEHSWIAITLAIAVSIVYFAFFAYRYIPMTGYDKKFSMISLALLILAIMFSFVSAYSILITLLFVFLVPQIASNKKVTLVVFILYIVLLFFIITNEVMVM